MATGTAGWDEYAPFYDWENARTFGRRDVAFWKKVVGREHGPTLELGCGTGRLLTPLARSGATVYGIDRSAPMLARAVVRSTRLRRSLRPRLLQGDVRSLPFPEATFAAVIAAYGLLQSLLNDADLNRVLTESGRVLARGGLLGLDLVPDLQKWDEYTRRAQLSGRLRKGTDVTLVESVRQDRRRGLTIFDEEFIERSGGRARRRRFSLTFRTVTLDAMRTRLEAAGFTGIVTYGDYRQGAWTSESDTWLVLARKA